MAETPARGRLLNLRQEVIWLPLEAEAPARHREQAPAVRAALQIFGIDVPLVAGVDRVAHRAAKRQVVADLARLAEEVVVVEQRAAVADGAAAGRPFR